MALCDYLSNETIERMATGFVGIEFADIKSLFHGTGRKVVVTAEEKEGDGCVSYAARSALSLLPQQEIEASRKRCLAILAGEQNTTVENIDEMERLVVEALGEEADVLIAAYNDLALADCVKVTLVFGSTAKSSLHD